MMKAVILYGQPAPGEYRADEADTQTQVRFVGEQLMALGWLVEIQAAGLNLECAAQRLRKSQPDLVFNLVEAIKGRGDLIHLAPALLDMMELPYTGCPRDTVYLTANKRLAKQRLRLAELPTPTSPTAREGGKPITNPLPQEGGRPEGPGGCALPQEGGRPEGPGGCGDAWIVKSVWEHASLGLDAASVVPTDMLKEKLAEQRRRHGGEWFAERYIEGREFNLSLLENAHGPEALPPAEIVFHAYPPGKLKIVDYAAKWDETSFEYRNTRRRFDFPASDRELLDELKRLALACWELFDLRGYARVDFRVDAGDRPWILEVNANPCLSPDAGLLAAAERAGLGAGEVISRIVASAMPPACVESTQRLRQTTAGG